MATELLCLQGLQADDINLAASDYLHHSLSLPALAGFVHRVERYLNQRGGEYRTADTRFMVIVRQFASSKGFPRGVKADYGYSGSGKKNIGSPRLMYQYQGRVTLDLIIRFERDEDGLASGLAELVDMDQLLIELSSMHLCSGTLAPVQPEQIQILADVSEQQRYLQNLQADGYLLEDMSSLLAMAPQVLPDLDSSDDTMAYETAEKARTVDDRLQRLLSLIARSRDGSRSEQGYVVPAAIGYRLLETPRPRYQRNAAEQYDHAFAEPMLGVVRLRSCASYRRQYLNEPVASWWGYRQQGNALYLAAEA